jgi:hypothetical protein
MPTELPLSLFRYTYVDETSKTLYSFAISLPDQMLQQMSKRVTGNTILETLSDGEKKRLKERLKINISIDAFIIDSFAPHRDDIISLPTFDGDEGRKFWIYPTEAVKRL